MRATSDELLQLINDIKLSPKRKLNHATEIKSKKARLHNAMRMDEEIKNLLVSCKDLKKENTADVKIFKKKIFDLKKEVKLEEINNKKEYIELLEILASFEDHNESLNLEVELLELKRNNQPDNHFSIVKTLSNLGNIYDNLGDKIKAKEYYENGLELVKKSQIKNHPSVAKTLNNLGLVYYDLGDKLKAKECYENALEIKNRILPKNHISLADTLHNLGLVYSDLGDRDKAIDHLQNSLEIKEKSLSKDDTSIATSLVGLGFCYFDFSEKKTSIWCLEKALEIYRKNLPANHSLIADTLNNLGSI
jgi:tetratricopeptide (TPR) repeat protein